MKNIARNWMNNLHGLRRDERGAESSEVILVLVLLVIGLLGAWKFLKTKIDTKARETGTCIDQANDANTCE